MTGREDILRKVEERAEKILASAPKPRTHWWIIGGAATALAVIAAFLVFGKSNYSIKDSNNATIIGSARDVTINNQINIRHWDQLEGERQDTIRSEALVLFPELFSSHYGSKYQRFTEWLRDEERIQHHNVKSLFTSTGRKKLQFENGRTVEMPSIFVTLNEHIEESMMFMKRADSALLSKHWEVPVDDDFENRFNIWAKKIEEYTVGNLGVEQKDVHDLMAGYKKLYVSR